MPIWQGLDIQKDMWMFNIVLINRKHVDFLITNCPSFQCVIVFWCIGWILFSLLSCTIRKSKLRNRKYSSFFVGSDSAFAESWKKAEVVVTDSFGVALLEKTAEGAVLI